MSERTASVAAMETDDGYPQFETLIRQRIEDVEGPVFTTDANQYEVWGLWLNSLPADRRQTYNCSCCRHFIYKYGGLVTIDEEGSIDPLLWMADLGSVPEFFKTAVLKADYAVSKAKVTGVFLWGGGGAAVGHTGDQSGCKDGDPSSGR